MPAGSEMRAGSEVAADSETRADSEGAAGKASAGVVTAAERARFRASGVVVVAAATSAPTAVEVRRADRAWARARVAGEAVPRQAGPPAGEGPAEAAEEAHEVEVEGADDQDEGGGIDDA